MTTILAIKIGDTIYMAGDTRTVGANGQIYEADTKIKQIGSFLIGGTGDTYTLDPILYGWNPPRARAADRKDPYKFFVNKVAPSIKKVLQGRGWVKNEKGDNGFEYLVAFDGNLYGLDDDWCTFMFIENIGFVGSGSTFGAGALSAGATIEIAMETAARHDQFTSAPFTYLIQKSTKRNHSMNINRQKEIGK